MRKFPFLRIIVFVVLGLVIVLISSLSLFFSKQGKESLPFNHLPLKEANVPKKMKLQKRFIKKSIDTPSEQLTIEADFAQSSFFQNANKEGWKEKLFGVFAKLEKSEFFENTSPSLPPFLLTASQASFIEKEIIFKDPIGVIEGAHLLYFKGQELKLNQEIKSIVLGEKAEISLDGIVTLEAKLGLDMYLTNPKNKESWVVEVKGPFLLKVIDVEKRQEMVVLGEGFVQLDGFNDKLTIDRGAESIHFSFPFGEVNADHFRMTGLKLRKEGKKIELFENVSLIQRALFDEEISPEQEGKVIRYVLCDLLEGNFGEKKINLQANEGKRVLLFDVANQCEMSARGFKFSFADPKGKVEGLGDVRLIFSKEEFQKMHSAFKGIQK